MNRRLQLFGVELGSGAIPKTETGEAVCNIISALRLDTANL
jgi:hypothetical protein